MKKHCFTMAELKQIERILKDPLDFKIEFAIKVIERMKTRQKEQKR